MNRIHSLFISVAFSLILVLPALGARSIIVAIAPGMSEADRQGVLNAYQQLLLKSDVGDVIQCYDAAAQRRVCTATVPKSASSRARLIALKREIAAIHACLNASPGSGSLAHPLNVPAFMTMVVPGLHHEGQTTRILVFGTIFHGDERDVGATFAPGSYPSDGCAMPSGQEFPLGTGDRKGSLAGVCVDWCSMGEDCGTLERRAVVRWWTIWCAELGATLTSCQATPGVAIESAIAGTTAPVSSDVIDRTSTDVVIRDVRPTTRSTDAPHPPQRAATDAELSEAASVMPTPSLGHAMISVVWSSTDGQADIDLWVRPAPGAAELSYGNRTTPLGRYLRDIQRSASTRQTPAGNTAWEGVEILDAHGDRMPEVWLNVYRNTGAPVQGIVRVQVGGRTSDFAFWFSDGNVGDHASNRNNRGTSPCWLRIDLTDREAPSSTRPR